MESEGTIALFKRSLELRGLVYKKMVGDLDTSTYKNVVNSRPYESIEIEKINCVNHYTKRFIYKYNKLKNVKFAKIHKDDKVVSLKGKYGLSNNFVFSLRIFMSISIKNNKGNLEGMINDGWSTFYHFSSDETNQNHDLCSESWCSFKKSGSYIPKNKYLPIMMKCLKPIYDDLLNPDELKKCLPGLTSNVNESIHSQIYRRIPKTVFINKPTIDIAVLDAIVCKNECYLARAEVFDLMGFRSGLHTKLGLSNQDDLRLLNSKKQKFNRINKYKTDENDEYVPGKFR